MKQRQHIKLGYKSGFNADLLIETSNELGIIFDFTFVLILRYPYKYISSVIRPGQGKRRVGKKNSFKLGANSLL